VSVNDRLPETRGRDHEPTGGQCRQGATEINGGERLVIVPVWGWWCF
jgi:hypothetical protein